MTPAEGVLLRVTEDVDASGEWEETTPSQQQTLTARSLQAQVASPVVGLPAQEHRTIGKMDGIVAHTTSAIVMPCDDDPQFGGCYLHLDLPPVTVDGVPCC